MEAEHKKAVSIKQGPVSASPKFLSGAGRYSHSMAAQHPSAEIPEDFPIFL
jgi:hypothetical protein